MAARKTPAKKAPAKKAPAKAPAKKAPAKTAAKKATATTATKSVTAVRERFSKTQILNQIAENTELSRKQVTAVLDELSDIIEGHVKKRSCGEFVMPGLFKIVVQKKPARKARKGINPFTGEETVFAAKPASNAVKIRPLKKLKEMAE
ncbi:HU family DNA-binding protein [Teredinibacter turnerae]|uniref:Viral histone-like protein n=1 Tax=Teredinibacter turnerae (strain ATCC 39867 / T7901) TaxID=377629 RepID=C5BPP1_TERTT|nr:HU family DNA-binding protein [Teredinibacter turnerae]ACR10992.1 DNA-binding protein BpH2 [Teredinibacter turnerae T7901]